MFVFFFLPPAFFSVLKFKSLMICKVETSSTPNCSLCLTFCLIIEILLLSKELSSFVLVSLALTGLLLSGALLFSVLSRSRFSCSRRSIFSFFSCSIRFFSSASSFSRFFFSWTKLFKIKD